MANGYRLATQPWHQHDHSVMQNNEWKWESLITEFTWIIHNLLGTLWIVNCLWSILDVQLVQIFIGSLIVELIETVGSQVNGIWTHQNDHSVMQNKKLK